MDDFRIVRAQTLLPIFSVAPIRGFQPASIVAIGKDLNYTSTIFYNGVLVSEFVVSSSTRLIIKVPESQVGKDLLDLKVYSSRPILNNNADLLIGVTKPLQKISGIDRLVQSWLMIFFTSPGSDVFSPQSGGGANTIVGSRTDRKNKSAATDLSIAIQRTEAEILQLQSKMPQIPPEEKLLSSSLEGLANDEATGTLIAQVRLKNMVNQSAQVSVS